MIPTEQQWCTNLLGVVPSIINYWYHYHYFNKRKIDTNHTGKIANHFLDLLHQDTKNNLTPLHYKTMDVSLVLYAEHE